MIDAIKKAKLSTNATTALIIIAGLFYLGFAFNRDPGSAAVQLLPVLGAMGAAIKIIHQGDVTEAKATEAANTATVAANTATQAAAQSVDNGVQLAVVAAQVDGNTATTNTTHDLVNSQTDAYKKLMKDQADLKVAMAEMQARLDSALARAEGMAEGRSQVMGEGTAPAEPATVSVTDPNRTIEATAPVTVEVKAP